MITFNINSSYSLYKNSSVFTRWTFEIDYLFEKSFINLFFFWVTISDTPRTCNSKLSSGYVDVTGGSSHLKWFLRSLTILEYKTDPLKLRGQRHRYPSWLNINCDFIYSWQRVSYHRHRGLALRYLARCDDEYINASIDRCCFAYIPLLHDQRKNPAIKPEMIRPPPIITIASN